MEISYPVYMGKLWGLFHKPYGNKDPGTLNNQDSMERQAVFFFVAQLMFPPKKQTPVEVETKGGMFFF